MIVKPMSATFGSTLTEYSNFKFLFRSATLKSGGCYMFSNLRGCDGQRTYFNGCSSIALNGEMVARLEIFLT